MKGKLRGELLNGSEKSRERKRKDDADFKSM